MKITIPAREIEIIPQVSIKGIKLDELIKDLFCLDFIGGSAIWDTWHDYVHHSLGGNNTGHINNMYLMHSDDYSKRHVFHLTWENSEGTAMVIFRKD